MRRKNWQREIREERLLPFRLCRAYVARARSSRVTMNAQPRRALDAWPWPLKKPHCPVIIRKGVAGKGQDARPAYALMDGCALPVFG